MLCSSKRERWCRTAQSSPHGWLWWVGFDNNNLLQKHYFRIAGLMISSFLNRRSWTHGCSERSCVSVGAPVGRGGGSFAVTLVPALISLCNTPSQVPQCCVTEITQKRSCRVLPVAAVGKVEEVRPVSGIRTSRREALVFVGEWVRTDGLVSAAQGRRLIPPSS